MELSVIIVNYNVKLLLGQCLLSVQTTISVLKNDAEIIVIDNNSKDGSQEYINQYFPGVRYFYNHENTGFAKACNQGLEKATGKYILFLNPDTIVPKTCFQTCISFFETHPDAGAVGVRMINSKGVFLKESKRGFPSPAASFFKLFGLAFLFPKSKTFAGYYLGHLPEEENNKVDVLSGAFMMVRKEVLEKIKGFDEDFFMYGEDIDLSYRINQAEFSNYYLGKTTITHFKGASTTYDNRHIKIFYEAMNLFVKKHYQGKRSSIYVWILYTGIWLRKSIALAGLIFR